MRLDEHPFHSPTSPICNLPEITGLPIRPVLQEVSLLDSRLNDAGTGIRWTLGPTWYATHENNPELINEFRPYFGDRRLIGTEPEPEPDDVPEEIKIWTAQMIASTTDFRVTGWSGPVPELELVHHVLRVRTTDGITDSYVVDGSRVFFMLGHLSDPNYIMVFPSQDPEAPRNHIPVRAITSMRHVVMRSRIVNA